MAEQLQQLPCPKCGRTWWWTKNTKPDEAICPPWYGCNPAPETTTIDSEKFIVVYSMENAGQLTDHYEFFEEEAEAYARYNELLFDDNLYAAGITVVIEATEPQWL